MYRSIFTRHTLSAALDAAEFVEEALSVISEVVAQDTEEDA